MKHPVLSDRVRLIIWWLVWLLLTAGQLLLYYFAYGSNLDKDRLIERIQKFHTGVRATLKEFKFEYSKVGTDGTAKANIIPSSGEEVRGVCYEIDESDLRILDKFEKGYNRAKVDIAEPQSWGVTYTSKPTRGNIRPSAEYHKIVLKGANDWELDKDYVRNYL